MLRRLLASFILVLPVGWLCADELRTLSGKPVSGKLSAIHDGTLTLETPDGPVAAPLSQVLALDLLPIKAIPADAKYADVRLIDDTILHCRDVAFRGKEATLTLLSGATLKLPLASLTAFVRGAEDAGLRKKFADLAGQKSRRDRAVILRDGELNPLEGTFGDVDAEGKTIQFTRDDAGVLAIQIERLHGMVFFRPEGPSESPICRVFDREGNVLAAAKLSYKDKTWQVTTTFGAPLSFAADAVAKLDFNMGKLTYLSDLEPSRVVERSFFDLDFKERRKDANLEGQPIRIDRRYDKGLSMHAYTELEYDLGGKYKDLKGLLGIDPRTGADSQPLVAIYCDGEQRFSETITAKSPRAVNLNVKDVSKLKIVVSSQDLFNLRDHVTFAEARVSQ